ncbi:MAG: TIGR02186 family protein [Geminicoccaceae bacterium]
MAGATTGRSDGRAGEPGPGVDRRPDAAAGTPSRRLRRLGFALGALALLGVAAGTARASGFIADLSHHLIAITTAFTGSNVLLFGALDDPGSDVVVVVRGPETTTAVRRKNRIGLVWLNTDQMTFAAVPSFYAIAASAPLGDIVAPDEQRRFRIGVDNLGLRPEDSGDRSADEIQEFREALVRNKEKVDLYAAEIAPVRFLGDKLFRTTLTFPANVPPGNYQIEVLQLRDGFVAGAQTSVLVISKVGLEAEIFDAARAQPAIYGLVSVILAIGAGWSAGVFFRKQ